MQTKTTILWMKMWIMSIPVSRQIRYHRSTTKHQFWGIIFEPSVFMFEWELGNKQHNACHLTQSHSIPRNHLLTLKLFYTLLQALPKQFIFKEKKSTRHRNFSFFFYSGHLSTKATVLFPFSLALIIKEVSNNSIVEKKIRGRSKIGFTT